MGVKHIAFCDHCKKEVPALVLLAETDNDIDYYGEPKGWIETSVIGGSLSKDFIVCSWICLSTYASERASQELNEMQ